MRKITIVAIIAALAMTFLWNITPKEEIRNKTIAPITEITGNQTIGGDLMLADGFITPGCSPSKITVTGNFTMGASASYICELKDLSGAGTGHDQIEVSGNLSLDGTLDINLDGYTPANADFFEIMSYSGTLTGTFSSITGLPSGWQIDYGLITPNKVTIYGPASPLPVELVDFRARVKEKAIELSWQTASEQNSDYFDIEHSTDARNFVKIGQREAQGTSNSIIHYAFMHDHPSGGVNYYRLEVIIC